jgi:hypothetical protein
MYLFPLNKFDPAEHQSQQFFLSYEFTHEAILQRDINLVGTLNLRPEHVRNLCQFWRYAFRLMVFSPGKIFGALDEVIITRWFAFVKDPMQRCSGFWRHAFPIGIWLIIWQFTLGLQSRIYARVEDYPIVLALLSALFECLTINKNTQNDQFIPTGLVATIQAPLPPELVRVYTKMFEYLEMCAIIVARVTQAIPSLDRARGILRGWPGMIFIWRAIDAAIGSYPPPGQSNPPMRLLPAYEYFESKVIAVWTIAAEITDGAFGRKQTTPTQLRELAKMRERCHAVKVAQRFASVTNSLQDALKESCFTGDSAAIPLDIGQLKDWATPSIKSITENLLPALQSTEKIEIDVKVQNASFPLLVFEVSESKRSPGQRDGVFSFCAEHDDDDSDDK